MKFIVADENDFDTGLLCDFISSKSHQVISCCANGAELLSAGLNNDFDVIISDLYIPFLGGLEAIRKIKEKKPSARSIILSANSSRQAVSKVVGSGVNAYILKHHYYTFHELERAIQSVTNNRVYIDSKLNIPDEPDRKISESGYELSSREKHILQKVILGKLNKEIAGELNISIKSVEHHKTNIYLKIGVKNSKELMHLYYEGHLN